MTPGGYTVGEMIHQGRRRVVYRGRRDSDDLPVLIKTSLDDFPEPHEVAALRREHDILAALPIDGVAQVVELATQRDRVALVLHDAGGTALKTLLADGPLPLHLVLDFGSRLAGILTELHTRGIIHKDVNPSNMLVDSDTGCVTLTDFGIASRLSSELVTPSHPQLLEGTIAYMSPEQTGRMNRDVDYRTDLYSLGATLYEALTGRLLFESWDPLEVIHGHMARLAEPPRVRRPEVPEAVSRLVMRLLAKAPEERYQSARGVQADLRRCAAALKATGTVADFTLGADDIPERFVLPQRLYGRDKDVAELLESFEGVAGGSTELALVAGYSGIGKSSLVHELYKSLPRQRGYLIGGKFDQLARDVPYRALAQAFGALVQQLLAESDQEVQDCAKRLSVALGPNGKVITDVIPALEQILGPQAPPALLAPAEAQNRFNLVFQKFIAAIVRPGHPLVVFLDDLQWADAATLALLPFLLDGGKSAGLLLIGAYRDNEVAEGHPLRLTLADLKARRVPVREITLQPLGSQHLHALVADALHSGSEHAEAVGEMVLAKTGGNPFFVKQLLLSLQRDGLIAFDASSRGWRADLEGMERVQVAENVVDLMMAKIARLPPRTQQTLRLAACAGSRFDLQTVARINEVEPAAAAAALLHAVEAGLVLPLDRSHGIVPGLSTGMDAARVEYRFLHDRVQQAAYALIAEADRHQVHLRIGRLLLGSAATAATLAPERLFEVVNHLDYGRALITSPEERLRLADLNLAAGRRAKSSAAYPNALRYFEVGVEVVPETAWTQHFELAFALHLERAEALYLCGSLQEAEAGFLALLERCHSPLDRAEVCALLMVEYETQSRYEDAIRSGLEVLERLGVPIPRAPEHWDDALAVDLDAIRDRIGSRQVASLVDLEGVDDGRVRQAMRLLQAMWAPAYISGRTRLGDLVAARIVRLSLQHGICEPSAFGFLHHALTVGSVLGEYERGAELGHLALAINERFADLRLRAVVHHRFAVFVVPWRRSFQDCIEHAREAVRSAFESGNLHVAGYAQFQQAWYGMQVERDLETFRERHGPTVELLDSLSLHTYADMQRILLQWAQALQGRTQAPAELSGPDFDEARYLQTVGQGGIFRALHATVKLELLDTFGHVEAARQHAGKEAAAVEAFVGTIWPALFAFRHALALCAWLPAAPAEERQPAQATLDALETRLARWAASAPQNFAHMHHLTAAEIARVRQQPGAAVEHYEAALEAAASQASPRHRALVNELYGRFWLERKQPRVAAVFLAEARYGYAQWGAAAKVADLECRYPDLARAAASGQAASATPPGVLSTTETLDSAVDVAAVMRAAQAIAREVDLESLLDRLMRVALETAGADRGELVLEGEAEATPRVRVAGSAAGVEVLADPGVPLMERHDLPLHLIQYVRRSLEGVILDDAPEDERGRNDPYIVRERPRSVLCAPVLNHGALVGTLYMENRLTPRAFTKDRVRIMQLLSAQAAIAIENARLYERTRSEVAERTRAEASLREALDEVRRLKERLETENVYLQEQIETAHGFDEIVGRSQALRRALGQVEQVAPTDTTVLIHGETGTGKELLARAVHRLSPRREHPLITVNCGAVAPGLVESELFGHEKGAFTGAVSRRIGRFEIAHGGTLFLDEIGDLALDLQVKLLRVLQEGAFERLGGQKTIQVDVRVIAATHRDLETLVRDERFRADLFYRLNVFPIHNPPLRERSEDIPELVRYFVLRYAAKMGKRIDSVPKAVLDALSAYAWPGNVRELANVIERSVILSRGSTLELEAQLAASGSPAAAARVDAPPTGAGAGTGAPPARAGAAKLADMERQHILAALERTGWRVSGPKGAAVLLGLKPTTLEARMKKLGVSRPR